ncbi:MAG: SDR family NAD(P)-dependent oxidoreductase [Halioglobus sp.]|jgi:NAD(P)-dependent dehydrogenase (short-subunit alcohol dehydrogenase family)|nr:SDR family NAD(P)-dependent oxidoreductase [Halioglobus sp.]
MNDKVAFITGASRGIGAESAVALAKAGYRVAITARTLTDGENHDHVGSSVALPGSLESTAKAVESVGGEALCLRGDILEPQSMVAAVQATLKHFGRIDVLFNNAVYQGTGNIEALLDVAEEQLWAIYQGNIFTPLALVKAIVPGMIARKSGTVLNMVSHSAFTDPPAAANAGGWGFAYPSSKAALARMGASLRAEHPGQGLRVFNLEPGLVMTDVMRLAGIDDAVMARFKPCSPAAIAAVVSWLVDNEPPQAWNPQTVLRGPAIAKELKLLQSPSLLGT